MTCAGFASQSLLTGLGAVQFVSNLVFVKLVLKEEVPPRCMLATFLIVVGNVVLVVFGNKDSPKYSVAELAALNRKDGMAAYMAMAYAGGTPFPVCSKHAEYHVEPAVAAPYLRCKHLLQIICMGWSAKQRVPHEAA